MDFNEINKINIDKTSIDKSNKKKSKNVVPEIKQQEIEENSPINPSYWQNTVGIKKQLSFKGINFNNIPAISDEPVDEAFLSEMLDILKNKINNDNSEEINECIENAKKISEHGKRALKNYVDIVSGAFKNHYPAGRIIEMTNMIFDKIPKFSIDCTEPLKKFFNEINCTDNEGYELVKDCISAVLSDNSNDDNKMAWISFHMPIDYKAYEETAALVTDYLNNYSAYSKFISHFNFGFMQDAVSQMNLSKNRMQDLSFLMDNNELEPKTLYNFAHTNKYYREKEWGNSFALKKYANDIVDMICDDKEKLELFKELVHIYPERLCFKSTDMIKPLKCNSYACRQLIDDLKKRPDNPSNGISFILLSSIIDENNINNFMEKTKGLSEREAYDYAKNYINPKTKKFDIKLADYADYLKSIFKMQSYYADTISKECVDIDTGEISPIADDFFHFVKRDEKNIKNTLMKSGFIMTKQLSMLHQIETNNDRSILVQIVNSLKNNEGHFEEKNLEYLKKIIFLPFKSGSTYKNYKALPDIMETIKDENGIVDINKYLNFKKIAGELNSLYSACKMHQILSKYSPEKANEIYSTILNMKINKKQTGNIEPDIINFIYDKEGNKNNKRILFVQEILSKHNIYGLSESFFEMCGESDDNMEFVKEISKNIPSSSSLFITPLTFIYNEFKDENNKFPQFVKENIIECTKKNISISYFAPLYNACMKKDENTQELHFDKDLFDKTINFMSIVQNKTRNLGNLSPETYIGIITNTLDISKLKFRDKIHALNAIISVDKYNTENGIKGYEFLSKMITDLNDSISVTKEYMPVKDEYRTDFIRNILFSTNKKELTPFEKIMTESIPELEKMITGLKIKYSRQNLLNDLSKICNENPSAIEIIQKKAGIELIFDGNITGYNGLISLNEFNKDDKTEKQIYDCLYKFLYENEVRTGNKELDIELNRVIKAFPEFINTIGKKQHPTHKYSLDIHQLLVLAYSMNNPDYLNNLNAHDKAVLKLSTLFHDVMKQENVIDNGHQYPSSMYARSILQKVVNNPENTDRIYEMINNHHWLASYANSNDKKEMAKELAFRFRRPNDFEIAKIMADSDLKGVSEEFYSKHKQALEDSSIDNISDNLDIIYSNGNALFTDYFVMPSKLANHIEIKDGKEYKVVNFHNIKPQEELSKYGFDSGTKKEDAVLLVHMVDENKLYESLNTVKILTSPINGGVLSESIITPEHNRTYCNRKYGLLLSHINTNIINEHKHNQGSGREKDISNIMSLIYDYSQIRQNFRNELLRALSINPKDIDDYEYADFYENVLASKTSLNQINPETIYNLGDYSFTGKELVKAIKYYQDSLIDKKGTEHNEIVGYIPKIQGVIAKEKSLSHIPNELLNFAQENNLPIILI